MTILYFLIAAEWRWSGARWWPCQAGGWWVSGSPGESADVSTQRWSVFLRSDHLSEGYTMTREDGWFDFMVNGGGAVTLQFGKSPFPPKIETLFAPWNEVSGSHWPIPESGIQVGQTPRPKLWLARPWEYWEKCPGLDCQEMHKPWHVLAKISLVINKWHCETICNPFSYKLWIRKYCCSGGTAICQI